MIIEAIKPVLKKDRKRNGVCVFFFVLIAFSKFIYLVESYKPRRIKFIIHVPGE